MSKLIISVCVLALLSCNGGAPSVSSDSISVNKSDSSKKQISYPYAIGYSADFEFIDPEKGKMVLDSWKDFDNDNLDNSRDKFADTVTMILPGMTMHASRDSIISASKAYRKSFTSVISKVDVVMSVRSTDKKGDWVLIWGDETHTSKKNITDSVALHEVWGLNKAGKIEFMQQYVSRK